MSIKSQNQVNHGFSFSNFEIIMILFIACHWGIIIFQLILQVMRILTYQDYIGDYHPIYFRISDNDGDALSTWTPSPICATSQAKGLDF